MPAHPARRMAGAARPADPAALRRGEPGADRGRRRRAAGGGQRRLAGGRGSATCWPRSRAGTAPRSGCTWRTRRTRQELLRSGDVLAAVTSDPAPVQGCTAEPLGALRYLPAAAPWFADRWRRGDSPDWAAMPVVVFNDKDDLQARSAPPPRRRRAAAGRPPGAVHRRLLPGRPDRPRLGDAARAAGQRRPGGGRLALLSADVIDVPLHWQRWRLDSPRLTALTDAVRTGRPTGTWRKRVSGSGRASRARACAPTESSPTLRV